ncbi:uncharacterized protein LOC123476821 [Daphnia magna]|uniref:uncharacterized protein LOC123476821 n=1 Tax=Daphnia magna TaxID=35525 RepID=UPI001E1BDA80|nr:uncharacterized protein LOC123476821 [Daphnia magna]
MLQKLYGIRRELSHRSLVLTAIVTRPKVIGVEENQFVHLSKLTVHQNNQPRKVQVPGLAQVAFNASFRVSFWFSISDSIFKRNMMFNVYVVLNCATTLIPKKLKD